MTKRFVHASLLAAGLVAVAAIPASASIIPVYEPVLSSVTPGNYTYDLDFTSGLDVGTGLPAERLDGSGATQSFITLYDINFGSNNPLTSVIVPANVSFTVQNTGLTAPGTLPTDSASLSNVTFRYTGPTLTADTTFPVTIQTSNLAGTTVLGNFTSETTANAGSAAGTPVGHIGSVAVPAAVPEPMTMSVIGLGAIGLLAGRRRRV